MLGRIRIGTGKCLLEGRPIHNGMCQAFGPEVSATAGVRLLSEVGRPDAIRVRFLQKLKELLVGILPFGLRQRHPKNRVGLHKDLSSRFTTKPFIS